jgi:hypothetical protein
MAVTISSKDHLMRENEGDVAAMVDIMS